MPNSHLSAASVSPSRGVPPHRCSGSKLQPDLSHRPMSEEMLGLTKSLTAIHKHLKHEYPSRKIFGPEKPQTKCMARSAANRAVHKWPSVHDTSYQQILSIECEKQEQKHGRMWSLKKKGLEYN